MAMRGGWPSESGRKAGKGVEREVRGKKQPKAGFKLSRSERIKSKKLIYPLSTSDKIVFITNDFGVGFRKEDLEDLGCPCHIPIDVMLKEINGACYNEWKVHFQEV
jgi:hypothetical protein